MGMWSICSRNGMLCDSAHAQTSAIRTPGYTVIHNAPCDRYYVSYDSNGMIHSASATKFGYRGPSTRYSTANSDAKPHCSHATHIGLGSQILLQSCAAGLCTYHIAIGASTVSTTGRCRRHLSPSLVQLVQYYQCAHVCRPRKAT